jgi:glyoxylase-like metal-dependent hydrolase (beta-lactamase superfamily II)
VQEILSGVHIWSEFSEKMGFSFNGYAVATERGTVAVDPPDPGDDSAWKRLDELAPFIGVYVTNRNHSRAAATFRDRYDAPVQIHRDDAEQAKVEADETLTGGESIADELRVVSVPGKSPGEIALLLPTRQALIVGDLVIGVPAGVLSTYPDEAIDDRDELLRSAEKLLDLEFDALLLCDGDPLPRGGKEKLKAFVYSHGSPTTKEESS